MVSPLYSGARILENSTTILNSTLATLEYATQDTPRMNKIFRTEKVFGLVPQRDVESAKELMDAEVHPQIQYLFGKIENELQKMRKRHEALQTKQRLHKVQEELSGTHGRPTHTPDPFKIGRLKFLQQKRKRLEHILADRNRKQKLGRSTPSLPPP